MSAGTGEAPGDSTRWDLEAESKGKVATRPKGPPEDAPASPGQRLSGCVVEKKLGQGGMGVVYLARRESDGQKVVVKFLRREHADDPTWRKRFVREGLLVKGLVHPAIVAVYDVELASSPPYIVMEFVPGEDLEDRLARTGRLPPLEATRIGLEVARGLAAAHAHGVVHRDVKPGNIRVTQDGRVKVLDFGLAKSVLTDEGISMAGQVLGTPYYMAPEQWGEHDVDARADVWSLGATLYHLVTGKLPFPGSRPSEILYRVLEARLPRAKEVVPDVPEDLDLAILRMLSRDRTLRYGSMDAVARDLEKVLAGEPVDVPCLIERAGGRRHPLMPGSHFAVGSDPACEVRLEGPGIAPHHAAIELERAGYRLHDEGTEGGTFVEGMRVETTLLRPGDKVRFGSVELEFRDGGLAEAIGASPGRAPAGLAGSTLPDAVVMALAASLDRRVVLALVEDAATEVVEARVGSTRQGLRRVLGGQIAEAAASAFERKLRRRASDAASTLFQITRENLGGDLEAWLRWWERARGSFPPQLGPYRIRPGWRLDLVAGEKATRTIELGDGDAWVLGRGAECQVQLRNMSVSRRHATILRLNDRLVIRDDGSRFGVRVNDRATTVALLHRGDRLALASVELVVQGDDLEAAFPRSQDGGHVVELSVVEALVELAHPSVALALLRFAVAPARLGWLEPWARRIFPQDTARGSALVEAVGRIYGARAEHARTLLPRIVPALAGVPFEPDGRAWEETLEALAPSLGPQLVPVSWFPDRPGKRASPLPRRLESHA